MKVIEILQQNRFVGEFGVPYLDDKVKGILPRDLILVGARSGAGKSSLAQNIAAHNSRKGTKVALISLENFEHDDFMTKAYHAYIEITGDYNLTIREFMGGIGTHFKPDYVALEKAEAKAHEFFKNIKLVTRKQGFTLDDLKKSFVEAVVEDGCRIIILDHIDYIDKLDASQNDVIHISETMRMIRDLQAAQDVAIIAISHLRKANHQKLPLIPSMDEFIGSGNKVKESTMVVMFAPDDQSNEVSFNKYQRATFCCIRKLRHGGFDNTCARLQYDIRTGNYLDEYDKLTVNYLGTEIKTLVE